jgi:hypothetical protein
MTQHNAIFGNGGLKLVRTAKPRIKLERDEVRLTKPHLPREERSDEAIGPSPPGALGRFASLAMPSRVYRPEMTLL